MKILKRARRRARKFSKKFKEYMRISHTAEIARRYFAMNSFDGILTILGILIGSYVGGIREPNVIIITCLGAAVAMGVSGFWGAYETEKAERARSLQELERATLSDLNGTLIGKAGRFATIVVSFVDGVAPFVSAMLVVFPFFLHGVLAVEYMFYVGVTIAFLALALLGAYLGKISKSNILTSSLKMVLAGIVCSGISMLLVGGAA